MEPVSISQPFDGRSNWRNLTDVQALCGRQAFWLSEVLGQRGKGDEYEYGCVCLAYLIKIHTFCVNGSAVLFPALPSWPRIVSASLSDSKETLLEGRQEGGGMKREGGLCFFHSGPERVAHQVGNFGLYP